MPVALELPVVAPLSAHRTLVTVPQLSLNTGLPVLTKAEHKPFVAAVGAGAVGQLKIGGVAGFTVKFRATILSQPFAAVKVS